MQCSEEPEERLAGDLDEAPPPAQPGPEDSESEDPEARARAAEVPRAPQSGVGGCPARCAAITFVRSRDAGYIVGEPSSVGSS